MGVESIGGGHSSGEYPLTPLSEALSAARARISERRSSEYAENIQHRHAMERDAHNQQFSIQNTVLSGAIQGYLNDQQHSNAKDLETHRDRIANRTFTKLAKYGPISDYSHGPVSVRFGASSASTPATPAATNKPQPPPVGNGLSPQFSNANAAPHPQGPHPLRPQP